MGDVTLLRTVRFRARHRYWRHDWSDAENRRIFGTSAETHGHDYTLQIRVRGDVDPETGFLVDLPKMDGILREVMGSLEGRDLDRVIPEAREGGMIPTTECLARWFWDRLAPRIPGRARLVRVRVEESDTLAAEYEG